MTNQTKLAIIGWGMIAIAAAIFYFIDTPARIWFLFVLCVLIVIGISKR